MNEPLEPKRQLAIYKTMITDSKFQLLEMSTRHNAMLINLPDALTGESYDVLTHYLKHLRDTLNACEAVRIEIDKRLLEME